MSASLPLRLYANPIKQVLYLLGSAVFVAVGLALIGMPAGRTKVYFDIIGWLCIIFFGVCTVVFLITFVVHVLVRRPVASIDWQGWVYVSGLSPRAQRVEWQRITRIALFRQTIRAGYGFSQTHYHLVLFGEADPSGQSLPRVRARLQRMYPMFRGAILTVPLNTLFLRATDDRCMALLERIEKACAQEIARYDIKFETHELWDI